MRRHLAIAALFAVLVLLGFRGAAAAAAPAGQVVGLFGACFVEADGRKAPLQLGAAVHVGDTIEVAAGAKLKLRLNDGSIVALASGSRLRIADFRVTPGGDSRDARLSLASGLARAVVSSLKGPSHFEISTATAVAAVRSTDWFIEADPQFTQVGVLSGQVSLKGDATGSEVVIPSRWGARVFAGKDPVPARQWTQAEFDRVIARTNLP